jgi:hypothetical protein
VPIQHQITSIETQVKGGDSAADPSMTALRPGSMAPGRADGGAIVGPGTSTSDEAGLYRLSNGEHVFDAGDVQKMGGQQAVYKFRAQLQAGNIPALAAGGAVGAMTPARQLVMAPGPASVVASGSTFEGNLYLDSGEFLGKVRGIAAQEVGAGIGAANQDASRRPSR